MIFVTDKTPLENLPYDFSSYVSMLTHILGVTENELARYAGISRSSMSNFLVDKFDRYSANRLLDFAYDKNIDLNQIKWQEYQDDNHSTSLILSHGSRTGINGPIRVDVNSESNDFSNGFYCGETLKQASMFVSAEDQPSLYVVRFSPRGLKPCPFTLDTEWMLAVSLFRNRLTQYGDNDLLNMIRQKVDCCDYVIAPIADNNMFEIIDAFADSQITDAQCLHALSATYLGNQYVMKTPEAAAHCELLDRLYMGPKEKADYSRMAKVEMNTSINKAILARKRHKDVGSYIFEILGDQ